MPENLKSYFYWAYGMQIESSVPLPDLIKTEAAADVAVRYGEISDVLLNSLFENASLYEKNGCRIRTSADAMFVEWKWVGKFLVRGGKEVIIEPLPDVIEDDLHPFLSGPIFSILLHQRGYFVLHASAVSIGGAAALFLGAKGFGKSTLAASLQVRGHQLISDDIVPVKFTEDGIFTVPGFPRIKLFEDSITAVGEKAANFPVIHRFVEKRSFRFTEDFSRALIPLGCLYLLSGGETIRLEKPALAAAFIEVMTNTFLNRFLEALDCQSEYFRNCQKLVQNVPVWKLNRPHNFEKMNEICSLIENHAAELAAEREICQSA